MITGILYHAISAVVPLYAAMILAYGSVKWWKIFDPDQCSGINRFVALFAIPLLSFHCISNNNPYAINLRFMAADTLQKIMVLVGLAIWSRTSSRGSLEWSITLFSLSTLPNTLIVGVPLLKGMYGEYSESLMVQIVMFQLIIWNTLMIFLYEYRGARLLIAAELRDTTGSIISIEVDSDIISLDGTEPLQTDAEVGEDGKLHITVRKSTSSPSKSFSPRSDGHNSGVSLTPRPTNPTEGAEIDFLQSSRKATPNFNNTDFYSASMDNGKDVSNIKDFRMLVGCSSASPVSEGGIHFLREEDHSGVAHQKDYDEYGKVEFSSATVLNGVGREGPMLSKLGSSSRTEPHPKDGDHTETKPTAMPPSVMIRLILMMVWRRLIRNPNIYSSLIGLIWSLVSYRWGIHMPPIIAGSVSIISDTALGMSMFALGLFMALQPKIIACGNATASFAMVVRFLIGPAVMAAASMAVGLRGSLLHIAIVQAALPLGTVTFVFAKEYDVHPDILSTGAVFSVLIALPITLVYYALLEL
ncbi:hypothetical protein PTKIN_Ptkin16aG0094300 [Pterospermum kingtungense]